MHENLLCFPGSKNSKQSRQRIEKAPRDALFQGDDGVVSDCDAFRTNLSTTLGDVAQSNAELRSQILRATPHVQRVHFKARHMHEKSWTNELFLQVVL